MPNRTWTTLACIAIIGWVAAGVVALAFVAYVGWIGILILGLFVLLTSVSYDLNKDHPGHLPSAHLMAQQYENLLERSPVAKQQRFARRLARNRLLYLIHTVGIALVLLGLGMTLLHQI